jgi:hypothetical protein
VFEIVAAVGQDFRSGASARIRRVHGDLGLAGLRVNSITIQAESGNFELRPVRPIGQPFPNPGSFHSQGRSTSYFVFIT